MCAGPRRRPRLGTFQRGGGVMSAKWRRCEKCRRVLSADEFDEGSDVCRADLVKATAKPSK